MGRIVFCGLRNLQDYKEEAPHFPSFPSYEAKVEALVDSVIFARPRHDYVPYRDYYRLVELSGFQLRYADEVNWQKPGTVIITPLNHEWWDIIPTKRAKRVIWHNLERGASADPKDIATSYMPSFVDDVWTSDRAFALETGMKYVFLGGHPKFADPALPRTSQYEVISLMYWYGRRSRLKTAIQARFSLADPDSDLWGEARHKALYSSQVMISAHQDEKPWSEPIRFLLAGSYRLPLVSERCADAGLWTPGLHFEHTDLMNIPGVVEELLSDYSRRKALAENAYALLALVHPFAREVEKAL